jgi:hypothetical protein
MTQKRKRVELLSENVEGMTCSNMENNLYCSKGCLLMYYLKMYAKTLPEPLFRVYREDGKVSNVYVRRYEENRFEDKLNVYMFSDDDYCDNLKNEFWSKGNSFEDVGEMLKEIYMVLKDNIIYDLLDRCEYYI